GPAPALGLCLGMPGRRPVAPWRTALIDQSASSGVGGDAMRRRLSRFGLSGSRPALLALAAAVPCDQLRGPWIRLPLTWMLAPARKSGWKVSRSGRAGRPRVLFRSHAGR